MNAYDCYVKMLAIKRHFSSSDYDYFKYNGKAKLKEETFKKKNNNFQYYYPKLKVLGEDDITWFFIANLIDNLTWQPINANFKEDYNKYFQYKSFLDALSYRYSEDVNKLSFKDLVEQTEYGEYNLLLKFWKKEIHIITLCILLDILPSVKELYDQNLKDHILWKDTKKMVEKLTPFIPFNKKKYKIETKKIFDEQAAPVYATAK